MHNTVIFTVIAFRLHTLRSTFDSDTLLPMVSKLWCKQTAPNHRQLPPCPLCRVNVRRSLNKPFQWPFFRATAAPPRLVIPPIYWQHYVSHTGARLKGWIGENCSYSLGTIKHQTMIDENWYWYCHVLLVYLENGFQFS